MSFKIVTCLAALCAVIASAQLPNNPNFEACKNEVGGEPRDPTKMPCIMACLGKKDGWLNQDGTINVDKKMQWAAQMSFSQDDLTKLKTAVDACKNVAQGVTDNCQAGTKLFQCMQQKGAPIPPRPPHP